MNRRRAFLLLAATLLSGCGNDLDVGSDVLWRALFETRDFSEWTDAQGNVAAFPATSSSLEVSQEHAHHGASAARLSLTTPGEGPQSSAILTRATGLPAEAYYSAWYYLPRAVTVTSYWVIFKLRARTNANDESSETELYDINLTNLPGGEMSLRLYDHRTGDVSLDGLPPQVPIGTWFQLEAFYRNASDARGQLTLWLDGRMLVDIAHKPMASNPWVGWTAASVAINLAPTPAVIFVDDCAVSRSRVGPRGQLER